MFDEQQYLDLVREILQRGVERPDRTGTGTISIFGAQTRWSLENGTLPLLTTKFVPFRAVALELLWMLKGCTNSKDLARDGVRIWDANGSREFLDSRGFYNRSEGDLGPVYGFQWRHWGAEYSSSDHRRNGIDQLARVIQMIRQEPTSRRIIMSAWNVSDLDKMALPPCHCFVQFYVANGKLSAHMYQRSADMGLGVPFNIASYALLTHIIAHITGLEAYELIHTIGDAHIYLNHVEALQLQLLREPKAPPTISIVGAHQNVDDIRVEDFIINNYKYDSHIAMQMSM